MTEAFNQIEQALAEVAKLDSRIRYLSITISINVNSNGISRASAFSNLDFDGQTVGKCIAAGKTLENIKQQMIESIKKLPSSEELKQAKRKELERQLAEL